MEDLPQKKLKPGYSVVCPDDHLFEKLIFENVTKK